MKYMGSKNSIAKYLVPIIEGYIKDENTLFVDLFCGGCNLVDKITKTHNKHINDNNKYLIALIKEIIETNGDVLYRQDTITETEYLVCRDHKDKFENWYVGLVGFCATFGGRFFAGYARGRKPDGTLRNFPNEAIRNLRKQAPNLMDIKKISCCDYRDLKFNNAVIYCDIPYDNTTKYHKDFDVEEFWKWAEETSKTNIVLVSEYKAPAGWKCLIEIPKKSSLNKETSKDSLEKLFIWEGNV